MWISYKADNEDDEYEPVNLNSIRTISRTENSIFFWITATLKITWEFSSDDRAKEVHLEILDKMRNNCLLIDINSN